MKNLVIDVQTPYRQPGARRVISHTQWATAIARRVGRSFGIPHSSQESDDIVSAAVLKLLSLAANFQPRESRNPDRFPNPEDLFRPSVATVIRFACLIEAVQLFNAGTFVHSGQVKRAPVHGLPVPELEPGVFRAPGSQLETDGRRAPPLEPLDELVRREDSRLPFRLTKDHAVELVQSIDLSPLPCGHSLDPQQFARSRDRQFWAKVLNDVGFSRNAIAKHLKITVATVRWYLGDQRSPSKRKVCHA